MNQREKQFEEWLEQASYNLEEEFINQLPPEEQPRTDDPDETEDILITHEEEWLKFLEDKYDEVFNNE